MSKEGKSLNEALKPKLGISGVRRSCIDFAEWILKEGFEKYEDNGKCWWGRFKEEDKDYSTEQLYEMWSGNYA
jgi:hypothetical protein